MHTHALAERIARLQHDILILGMSNLSEERLHEMIDDISDKVAVYAAGSREVLSQRRSQAKEIT